jgi:hypothetical protein
MTAVSGPPSCTPGSGTQPDQRCRALPKAIQLLLPVWGKHYIEQFLRVSLPTLLAPGNLPALARALPCQFIFLTSSDGAEVLRDHAGILFLRGICSVDINIIDDLITGDNYSTTITLAYARAVMATGAAMQDTCFFFLISDYIVANGSLANVLTRMLAGYDGVLAGNFQVVEEDADQSLFKTFDTGEPAMNLSARDLMHWALRFLHPVTLANTVNFPLCSSSHSNRLFWRVDENALIGRFYLMHMICIRPEVADFVIGSSCDYSFIPEMCPSGNVHVMTDSDDYLVVEMQKHRHEMNFVRLGAANQKLLIDSLAEWTTARHRANAHSAVIFHATEILPPVGSMIEQSSAYIQAIERRLPAAQPHRNHPYWIGAMAAHRREIVRRQTGMESSDLPREITVAVEGHQALLYRCRNVVFGMPPLVKVWHPRWPDYAMFARLARCHLTGDHGRLLIVSSSPATFRNWLNDIAYSVNSVDLAKLLDMDADRYAEWIESFGGCLLVLSERELAEVQKLIGRILPLLSPGACLLIFGLNGHGVTVGRQFNNDLLRNLNRFFVSHLSLDEVQFISAGWATWAALRAMRNAMLLSLKSWLYVPFAAASAGFLLLVSLVGNVFSRRSGPQPWGGELCSSIGIVMHKSALRDSMSPAGGYDALTSAVKIDALAMAARRFERNSVSLATANPTESA